MVYLKDFEIDFERFLAQKGNSIKKKPAAMSAFLFGL